MATLNQNARSKEQSNRDLSKNSQDDVSRKIKKASALAYEPGADKAPRLVASGKEELAEKIIEAAEKADVQVYEDEHLADVLSALKVGTEIPKELYEVVAEVLAFISRLDDQASRRI